ncbi:MAG: beta-propeller fold lactonase family protein [Gaiellales bacterium]
MLRSRLVLVTAAVGLLLIIVGAAQAATPACGAGQVYTETNDPTGNQLVVLQAGRNGLLTQRQLVDAGGLCTGEHLTSGGAVAVSTDGCRVAAVNAASGAVAVFTVSTAGRAAFAGSAAAGGAQTISVAIHGTRLATLSTTPGGTTTIQTFTVGRQRVTPVPGSLQTVGDATDGGQIAFTARGRYLVVTTRKSQGLATFRVGNDGVPTPAESLVPLAPMWTYGFGLTPANQAIVSLLDLRPPESGAFASEQITSAGGITPVSTPILGQAGACWVAVGPSGQYAWGLNAVSKEVATLSVSNAGAIAVLGTIPVGGDGRDMATSADGHFLYVSRPDAKDIAVFRIGANGLLTLVGSSPTPATAVSAGGIAAS